MCVCVRACVRVCVCVCVCVLALHKILSVGCGFIISGLGDVFRILVRGAGCGVWGVGCERLVQGLGCSVQGLGFGV